MDKQGPKVDTPHFAIILLLPLTSHKNPLYYMLSRLPLERQTSDMLE